MRILLAPMEGVLDHTLRRLLTTFGGVDRCVTEFVRVTDQRLPTRTFLRLCPELLEGGVTASGVPVFVQLLGGQPLPMARNARRAAALGAPGIDLNFGCPAKTVNRHDGGSILLREPERVYAIIKAVRDAVPAPIPVTAKIRLGYEDHHQLEAIAVRVADAGASELTIHARTKTDGYKPPAYWHLIDVVRRQLSIPVIANGEIWSPADCRRAQAESGCADIMVGRGALSRPDLPRLIRADLEGRAQPELAWPTVVEALATQLEAGIAHYPAKYAGNPIKQWLGYLRRHYTEAAMLFESIKRLREVDELRVALAAEWKAAQKAA